MIDWKVLLPHRRDLEKIAQIASGDMFVHAKNDPVWTRVYVLDATGQWITLSWDYLDVEFKFEIYGISAEYLNSVVTADLIPAGTVPSFAAIGFLLKTSWVRPALPGEVPENYEQVIEESGVATAVPSSATVIATGLYGVLFRSTDGSPRLVITIDDDASYSLRSLVDNEVMAAAVAACDSLSFDELIHWEPPLLPRCD